MYYSHAIEILDNFEAGIYTEDDVMKAIDKILSMETINAVRKDLLLKALRFARQRIDWDDYWNNAKPIRAESTDNEYDDNYICPACGNETLVYGLRGQIGSAQTVKDEAEEVGMMDVKKVIQGLENCPRLPFDLCYAECMDCDCPYYDESGIKKLHQDAVALLKEFVPVCRDGEICRYKGGCKRCEKAVKLDD